MGDGSVGLPPSSSGQPIRVEIGDPTNQIPTGVGEEAVIPTDAQGLFAGDARMLALPVTEQTMQEVLTELRRIGLALELAFDVELER